MQHADLLIRNARQLVHFVPQNINAARQEYELYLIPDAWLAVKEQKIAAFGTKEEVLSEVAVDKQTETIDATGKTVTPGLIDPHTHPVFFLTREVEFEMRIKGKSYEEIAAAGGGIRNSVRAVRQAGKRELKTKILPRLRRFLELGTTTIEAKSGYGLSFEDEVKSLEIIKELNEIQPLEMHATFLGAHEIPDEYRRNREEYIHLLQNKIIPFVAKNNLAEFCDVFCEQGVYSVEESRRILTIAQNYGLKSRVHADQLHLTGATQMAVELGAVSADHLEKLDDGGIRKIAASNTVACLLPGAVFFLGSHQYPPGRKLIDTGARVCLATDFNPGSSMTQSQPLMMSLACLFMKMTPAEALQATTVHAAAAIARENELGNIALGYRADLVVWNAEDYRQIPYYYGVNLAEKVIKRGKLVFSRQEQ